MKLRRLRVQRLPGIDEAFTLEGLGDGLHVVVGPNGIGKSSLCRATQALLWKDRQGPGPLSVSAVLEAEDGSLWTVERDGARHRWQCDGQDSDPPKLPAVHLHRAFFLGLRDLLDVADGAGSDVATEIRLQMSGGYDIARVAALFPGPASLRAGNTRARKAVSDADSEVRTAQHAQTRIAAREASLDELDARRREAEQAQARRVHVQTALELGELRARHAQICDALQSFPATLATLTGEELRQLERCEAALQKRVAEREAALELRHQAQRVASETGLQAPLDIAELEAARIRGDALADAQHALDAARLALAAKQAAAAEASRHVGGVGEPPAELTLAGQAALFSLLDDLQALAQERLAIEARVQLLELDETGRATDADVDQTRLRRGVESLRSWLRASDPAGVTVTAELRPSRGVMHAVAGVLVLLGSVCGLVLPQVPWGMLGLGLGVGLGLGIAAVAKTLRVIQGGGTLDAREAARREFPSALRAPANWSSEAVLACLDALERELARCEATTQLQAAHQRERHALETSRRHWEARASQLAEQRNFLAQQLGLESLPSDAKLIDMARAFDQLRCARGEFQAAASKLQALQQRFDDALEALCAWLVRHGAAAATDAASARAGVAQLQRRDATLRSALRDIEAAARQLATHEREIAELQATRAAIYHEAQLAIDDRVGLTRLLADFPRYQQLRAEGDQVSREIAALAARLDKAGESGLADTPREALEHTQRALLALAEQLGELHEQAADIRAAVRTAKQGSDLEAALARRRARLEALAARRVETLYARAGAFLLERVQRQHETLQMPRVLDRARALFADFTHAQYGLRLGTQEDSPSFIAVETHSKQGRRPDELSDGTRAQLVLAARLAFAEEAEHGARLPLFLDEALDHSDPRRFHAIARSLGRIVTDASRQLFYFTNDPADVMRIQSALAEEGCAAPQVIDLAEVRKQGRSVTRPEELYVAPFPSIPSPEGRGSEAYGVALGVPPFEPLREPSAQHLFYLLWDDLGLLHRLLQSRIERVGQWLELSARQAPLVQDIQREGGVGAQLDARAELLGVFLQAWRRGRGRPIDPHALRTSGVLRGRYAEPLVEVVDAVAGDAQQLLNVLDARSEPRLSGFRSKSRAELETYLHDHGYLDTRAVLDEAELAARVMASAATAQLPERSAAACVHQWWALCALCA